MKRVLFLAPNYKYIRTTVTGITKDLVKRKIPFTTNVHIYPNADKYEEGELKSLYLKTSEVEVVFNFDDPVTWSIETLSGIDAVYGKKELVETLRENYPSRVVIRKGSVQRYIVATTLDSPNTLIVDDIHPVRTQYIPTIKNAYFNDPMTIVIWEDGTKTMVKCQDDDVYSKEVGLAMCIAKKAFGNKGNFNDIFKKWIPEPEEETAYINSDDKISAGIDGKSTMSTIDAVNEYLDDIFKIVRERFKIGTA